MAIATAEVRQREPDIAITNQPRLRGDIEGLRAIAVLLVIAYHAGFAAFHGGFVGVDIFFVLSGYLITQLLLTEIDGTHHLALARFYARRARRLLPAVGVMLVAVVVATFIVKSPLEWRSSATEVWATIFYVSNRFFAGRSTSYFGATINASPLLHTWTLAVEEQFYLVWPVVLFAIARATAGSRPRTRVYAIGTLTALSLLFSLRLTNELAPSAFYGLGSRAWEFGCGALLACTVPFWKRQRQRSRDVLSLAGAALLVVALVQITAKTPYPGRAALLPVGAAVALLASGIGTSSVVGVALARPALRAIGRISYSWYLWHWPVLLFGEHMLNRSTLTVRVALLTFSVVPAIASYRLVERPIRQNIVLGRSQRATVRTVGAFVAATIVAASVLTVVGDHELRDPYIAMLARARADRPPLNLSCWVTDPSVVLRSCVSGDANATRTIMVVGDSHAAQWLPAIDEAARELHVRVVTSVEGNCPGIGSGWTDQTASCTTRLRNLPELIRTLHPALVISSNSSGYIGVLVDARGKRVRSSGQLGAWGDEMFTFASELRADNIPLLDVLDTPHYASDPLDCLANDRDASRCSLRRDTAVASVAAIHKAEIDALTRARHGTVLDPSDILCGSRECPIVVGGQVTYNDGGHLTKSYAATLGGVFTGAIRTTTR